jgi:hypothetical protein
MQSLDKNVTGNGTMYLVKMGDTWLLQSLTSNGEREGPGPSQPILVVFGTAKPSQKPTRTHGSTPPTPFFWLVQRLLSNDRRRCTSHDGKYFPSTAEDGTMYLVKMGDIFYQQQKQEKKNLMFPKKTPFQELVYGSHSDDVDLWLLIASEAWSGFVNSGRGAVVVNIDHEPPLANFLSEQEVFSQGGWESYEITPAIQEDVQAYNPSTEIVTIINSNKADFYRIKLHNVTPPMAYHALYGMYLISAA